MLARKIYSVGVYLVDDMTFRYQLYSQLRRRQRIKRTFTASLTGELYMSWSTHWKKNAPVGPRRVAACVIGGGQENAHLPIVGKRGCKSAPAKAQCRINLISRISTRTSHVTSTMEPPPWLWPKEELKLPPSSLAVGSHWSHFGNWEARAKEATGANPPPRHSCPA